MKRPPLSAPADAALSSAVESILFVASGPVSVRRLCSVLAASAQDVHAALAYLHGSLDRGIRLQLAADLAQLVSAPENAENVRAFLGNEQPPALSKPALETLAIVAYRQPTTRAEIEAVRGVNSDRPVRTLLSRGLIEERGTRASPGRPMQYGTGFVFLEYFGLGALDDLPALEPSTDQRAEAPSAMVGVRAPVEGD